jgi:hypothetical protein
LGHTAKVNEIEVILWICPFQLGIIDLKFAAPCQHRSTAVSCKRTHQFGGTLFGRAVSSLLPTPRLSILTISAEVGYIKAQLTSLAGHGATNCQHVHLPEIKTQNLGGRVIVRHINGPDTGSGPDVKDALWVAPYGCFMKLPF